MSYIPENLTERLPVEKLRFYDNNPRKNDAVVDQMVESIQHFGFRLPILVKRDGEVVDGHLRLKGALKLGMPEVPVLYADGMSEDDIRAFRILVNRSVNWAKWDDEKLAEEIAALVARSYEIALTGFDSAELDKLLKQNEKAAKKGDPEDCPELPKNEAEIRVQRGDIWALGTHRLMCGDSTSVEDMAALMDGERADLWLTDPPYNVAYEGKTKDALKIENDAMKDDDFRAFLVAAYGAANSVMRPGAVFYIWHADSEGYNFRGAARDVGWQVRQCIVWAKQHFVMGRQDYQWKHEPCLYGWKDGAAHKWNNDRSQTTVLEFDRPARNAEHPTMKPVALFEYQIGNSSRHGEIVLDSFGGSGTTVMACERMGRRARVMELDTKYAEVILKRWEKFTNCDAELVFRRDKSE